MFSSRTVYVLKLLYLEAYFESSISYLSAYAGAIILFAATGSPMSATDLAGNPWVEGNPMSKRGILAWGTEELRRSMRQAAEPVFAGLAPPSPAKFNPVPPANPPRTGQQDDPSLASGSTPPTA